MKMGTKSLLFGAHQFILHPIVLFFAWWKLYGFPWDPRLWVAFVVHDLGYFGMAEMDSEEGEHHPVLGAEIMSFLFGPQWSAWCYHHSRFLSRRAKRQFSTLCVADKLAIALTPAWLYIPMVRLTGEIKGYRDTQKHKDDLGRDMTGESDYAWFRALQAHMRNWVESNKYYAFHPHEY